MEIELEYDSDGVSWDEYERCKEKLLALGYDMSLVGNRKTASNLVRLLELGIDLEKYGVTKDLQNDYSNAEKIRLLLICCENKLNLFMFKTYAWKVSHPIVLNLADMMWRNKDYTMLLDYSKMDETEALNFISALSLGVDKNEAMRYYRGVRCGDTRMIKSLFKNYPKEDILRMYNYCSEPYMLGEWLKLMKKYELDYSEYFCTMSSLTYSTYPVYEQLIKLTKGKFVPNSTNAYTEYVDTLIGSAYSRRCDDLIVEACHRRDKDWEEYSRLTNESVIKYVTIAIMKEIDIDIYLNMGYTDEELVEILDTATARRGKSVSDHIGLKLHKRLGGMSY